MAFNNSAEIKWYRRKLFLWRILSFLLTISLLYFFFKNPNTNISAKPHIANYVISGLLVDADQILKDLESLEYEDNVRAIIITVDSPGGTTVSAEEIFLKIRSIASKKPIVVVMKNIATSGAYLLSIGADRIFARENTITGSVGVLLQWARIDQGLEKLGVEMKEVKSGKLKAEPDLFGESDEEAIALTQAIVDETYEWFLNLVKERREIREYVIRQISDGRILTGRQALDLNLIDEIGGNREAKSWLINNREINTNLEIQIYEQNKNTNFIELSVAKIMDYFNINSSYGNSLKTNLSLINIDGLLSIWQHPS
jgi:protease-4